MPLSKGTAAGSGSSGGGSPVEVVINHADDSIKIGDGTNTATITTAGAKKALDVNVVDIAIDQASDSVRIGDGTSLVGATTLGGSIALNVVPLASSAPLSSRVDEASSTVTYVGKAALGSAEASSVWQVQRITTSGSVLIIEWADSNANFDNSWTNRASLTYG
jgi:hypothetical protein